MTDKQLLSIVAAILLGQRSDAELATGKSIDDAIRTAKTLIRAAEQS